MKKVIFFKRLTSAEQERAYSSEQTELIENEEPDPGEKGRTGILVLKPATADGFKENYRLLLLK